MTGTIGILTGRGSACDELADWLDTLAGEPGGADVTVRRVSGNQVPHQRNLIAHEALDHGASWVAYVDADVVPASGALWRLLETGLPLIGGAVVERTAPFDVCAVRSLEPYARWTADELAMLLSPNPFPVVAVGTGFLLVRRGVFERVPMPWFRCGQVAPDLLAEDLDFCLRAAAAGFVPHLHPRARAGHHVDAIFWPGDAGLAVQWPSPFGRLPWRESLELGLDRQEVAG